MNSQRFLPLALLFSLSIGPRAALAQNEAGRRIVAPEPAPTPPPAATGPAPVVAPTPPPAPEAAPAPAVAPDAAASADDDDARGDHKKNKHKKNKHKKRDRDDDADAAPPGTLDSDAAAGPEYGGLVFSSSGGSLQLKGRIFALAELAHRSETVVDTSGNLVSRDITSLDLSLASARVGLEYRSPLRWLSADLELEIAGKPQVKDAYIQAGKRFYVKAGQFKVPTAALELESPWAVPTVRRGLVHDLLTDWLDVAGRRPGVLLGYRCKCELKPRLELGAFQGTTLQGLAPGDRDVQLIEKASLKAQSLAARGELKLVGVQLGAWYEHRVGSKAIGEFSYFPTFGIDATYDQTYEHGGARLWLDGSAGKSLYVNADKPGDGADPWFTVGRALLAYRFGGVALGDPYVEPFGFFALLDPDTEVVADFATEAALGVNAGYWDRARLSLQGEMTNGQRNLPGGFLENYDPDRLSLLLQAGARF